MDTTHPKILTIAGGCGAVASTPSREPESVQIFEDAAKLAGRR